MSILSTVPKECLNEIWSWLPWHEIRKLARVCKQLSNIWNTIERVEFVRFFDPEEIQPLLQKRNFNGVKHFKFRGHWELKSAFEMSDIIYAALNGKQLTSLDLDCRLIGDAEKLIGGMTSLERVCLYYKRYPSNDPTIDFGEMFPNHPHLSSFAIKKADFEYARGWDFVKNLEYLELGRGGEGAFFSKTDFQFPDSVLNNLNKLRIEFLCLENTGVFKAFPNLTHLELCYVKFGELLTPLFNAPKLVSAHWQSTQKLNESTIRAAGHNTQLTKLFFLDEDDYFEYYDTDFNGVNNMTHLKELAIIESANLSGLTNLEKLRLSFNAVPAIGSAVDLPKLVDLSLTDTSLYKEDAAVLSTLCTMTNLTRLHFSVKCRQERDTRPLLLHNFSKLQNLRELEIMPLESEDEPSRFGEVINAISSITSLRVLAVVNAVVASVTEMAKLTQLQLLRVLGKPDFDKCHVPLKNIPVEYYGTFDPDELHAED